MTSLEEAIGGSGGDERPFHCPQHDDSNASASVNVVKGVWYCHACGASGTADNKGVPSTEALEAMITSDPVAPLSERMLPFWSGIPHSYWAGRFHKSVIRYFGLGTSPSTGMPTFPVRYSDGTLAGFGSRNLEGVRPKYLYPRGWSASRTLYRSGRCRGVVILVEGASDVMALAEVGVTSFGLFGSRMHAPQADLVRQMHPTLVVAATDSDLAGENGCTSIQRWFPDAIRMNWGACKDPGEMHRDQRWAWVLGFLSAHGYGPQARDVRSWWKRTYQNKRVMTSHGPY